MNWIVNEQKVMIACGDDDFKSRCSIGPDQMWLEVPEGVAVGNCKVSGEWPELSLVDGSADKSSPKWEALRKARNEVLASTDWTQMSDSPLSTEEKSEWVTYRQALRNLIQNTTNPDQVTWPVQPS